MRYMTILQPHMLFERGCPCCRLCPERAPIDFDGVFETPTRILILESAVASLHTRCGFFPLPGR